MLETSFSRTDGGTSDCTLALATHFGQASRAVKNGEGPYYVNGQRVQSVTFVDNVLVDVQFEGKRPDIVTPSPA